MPDGESLDTYADGFFININPWGAYIAFGVQPDNPETPMENRVVVRMSTIHLKAMVYVISKSIKGYETEQAVSNDLPPVVYPVLGIDQDEWKDFWK